MATPLTKPQKFVLYILVSTKSQVRFALEGLSGDTYGSAGSGPPTAAAQLALRVRSQLRLIFGDSSLDETSIPAVGMLYDAGTLQTNNVTLDPARIRTAIGMDAFYDPGGDPCPSDYSNVSHTVVRTNEMTNIVNAILGPVHNLLVEAPVIPPAIEAPRKRTPKKRTPKKRQ